MTIDKKTYISTSFLITNLNLSSTFHKYPQEDAGLILGVAK